MCLLVLALNQSPQYPLVLIANRDEDHRRPSVAANHWPEDPRVVGGRDLLRGGTWLAVDDRGRLGAVTNFRDDNRQEKPRSRGDLVTEFIRSSDAGDTFSDAVNQRQDAYAGFNLIVGQVNKPFCYQSNRVQPQVLAAGVYGVSNGGLDNCWPKVTRSKARLQQWLQHDQQDQETLFSILADRQTVTGDDTNESTHAQSTMFIVNPAFGTRACTCILIGADGLVQFEERRFDAAGKTTGSSQFEFGLKS